MTGQAQRVGSVEPIAAEVDVLLVGAGVMSATLGMMLRLVSPGLRMAFVESRGEAATESSDAWNNAGTGHAALCELNYTPEGADGSIAIDRAVKINEQFLQSRQFWATLVERGLLRAPDEFIHAVPHESFVSGGEAVDFLRRRHQALSASPLFAGMQFTDDAAVLREWMPLMMEGRDPAQKVAATRSDEGTDLDFGALTRQLLEALVSGNGVEGGGTHVSDARHGAPDAVAVSGNGAEAKGTHVSGARHGAPRFSPDTRSSSAGGAHATVHYHHALRDLTKLPDGRWYTQVEDLRMKKKSRVTARFVFLGAGGGALPLLQRSGIPEGRGYGGFPVSGQWLRCTNRAVIEEHAAKVYGKPALGAPPMSVPHLDTRVIEGKRELLFGPFAGFSTKFLKGGSFADLPRSIGTGNLVSMLGAGATNLPLTKYLVGQVMQSQADRVEALREFVPSARGEDWKLEIAGQRVQIIKGDAKKGGRLEFGTEIVRSADGSMAALLGASPGASTAVAIMLELLQKGVPGVRVGAEELRALVPSFGLALSANTDLLAEQKERTRRVLGLDHALEAGRRVGA